MKKIFLVLVLALGLLGFWSNNLTAAVAYESISVTNAAVGFTAASIATGEWQSNKAFCTLETAQVRVRYDGTDPTSSEGHLMNVGDNITLEKYTNISKFKAIRTGGTSGTLKCSYE